MSKTIAQGALTSSKRAECFVKGIYPTHATKGLGPWLYDDKGRKYLDFICALGTDLFGYARPEIIGPVQRRLYEGNLFSLSHPLEDELGQKLCELVPGIEKIKVLKTGTEACMAACIIARAVTGRPIIVSEGYHGWSQEFTSLTPPAHGCRPSLDIHPIKSIGIPGLLDNVAGVIVEPIITDASPKRIQWLKDLREKTKKSKTLLIFDETITAFRFPGLSVAKYASIKPDLIILGKALGAGLPISVLGGRQDAMDAPYFVSGSFCGDLLGITAALESVKLAHSLVDGMWEASNAFVAKLNALFAENGTEIHIGGYGMRGVFEGPELEIALFWQEMCKARVLFGPSFFWCEPHAEHAQTVLNLASQILGRMNRGEIRLEGELPLKPHSQKVRENDRS